MGFLCKLLKLWKLFHFSCQSHDIHSYGLSEVITTLGLSMQIKLLLAIVE